MAYASPSTWYGRGNPGVDVFPLGTKQSTGSISTLTLTGISVPAGACIVVLVSEVTATVSGSCADATNGAYTLVSGTAYPTAAGMGMCFIFPNSAALTNASIVYTKNASAHNVDMTCFYVTGVKTSSPVDSGFTATATGTSTAPSVTSNAPAAKNEFVFGAVFYTNASARTLTLQAGWNFPPYIANGNPTAQVGGGWQYNAGASAITFAPTISASSGWLALIVALQPATAPTTGWHGQVNPWANGAVIAAGALRRQNAPVAIGNGRVWACSIAGTTGGSEPTWTLTQGAKTTDNTVTWIEVTGQPGVNGDITNSPQWTVSSTPPQGLVIYDPTSLSLQVCTTSGAGGTGAKPSFSATAGVTTADASATWTSLGLASGFAKWAAPFPDRLAAENFLLAGCNLLLANDHLEFCGITSYNVVWQNSFPPVGIISVDPTTLAASAGAKVHNVTNSLTGAPNVLGMLESGTYCAWGITYRMGAGILCNSGGGWTGEVDYSNCGFEFYGECLISENWAGACRIHECSFTGLGTNNNATANNAYIGVSVGSELRNNTFAGQYISTGVFNATASQPGGSIVDSDLSGLSSASLVQANTAAYSSCLTPWWFVNCKLPNPASVPVGQNSLGLENPVYVLNCDVGSLVYQYQKWTGKGSQVLVTDILRTGGYQTIGGANATPVSVSWKIITTAFASVALPFVSLPIPAWNAVIGGNVIVTIYGMVNAASLPNNNQIWLDLDYFGNASAQGVAVNSGLANPLSTAVALTADSTSVWNSAATARQNTHAYSFGDAISVSSNTRVFFCTSAGTSSGSLPGGYASAVDGGVVTDGGATFRAGVRFSIAITLSAPQPQLVGFIKGKIKAAQVSQTFWIDPVLNLS